MAATRVKRSSTNPDLPWAYEQLLKPDNDSATLKIRLKAAIVRHFEHGEKIKESILEDYDASDWMDKVKEKLPFMIAFRAKEGWKTLAYQIWLRFLVSYSSCLCIMVLLAWFSGFLMEIFFSVFVPDSNGYPAHVASKYIGFLLLPIGIILTAFLGDEMCDMVLDSVQYIPLTRCRATILAGLSFPDILTRKATKPFLQCLRLSPTRNNPIPHRAYSALDVWMGIVLNVVPGCCALNRALTTYRWGPSVRALFAGAVYGIAFTAIIFAVTDILVSRKPDRIKLRDMISEELRVKRVYPGSGSLSLICESINRQWEDEKDCWTSVEHAQRLRDADQTICNSMSPRSRGLVVAAGMLLWGGAEWLIRRAMSSHESTICLVSLGSLGKPCISTQMTAFVFCACTLMLVVSLLSHVIAKTFPGLLGMPFVAILMFFLFASSCIIVSGVLNLPALDISPLMTVERDHTFMPYLSHHSWNGSSRISKYPVCNMAWGAPTATLSSLDLAGLSYISYANTTAQIKTLLNQSYNFSGSQRYPAPNYGTPNLTFPPDDSDDYYDKVPRVLEVHFPSNLPNSGGTRVFAIKGTSTAVDAVTDASFFAGIEVLQFFNNIFPVLTVFPAWRIQWMLRPSFNQQTEDIEQDIFAHVEQRINKCKQDHPMDEVILTGHSLGGGIAQIVAARMGIPALVWSAPGILFSSHRFAKNATHNQWDQVDRFGELAKRSVTVVVPDDDPVPRVDLQMGMVQPVECRSRNGTLLYAWQCHPIKKTACEIWRVCGDTNGRDFRHACNHNNASFYVSPDNTGEPYFPADVPSANPWIHRSVAIVVGVISGTMIIYYLYVKAKHDQDRVYHDPPMSSPVLMEG